MSFNFFKHIFILLFLVGEVVFVNILRDNLTLSPLGTINIYIFFLKRKLQQTFATEDEICLVNFKMLSYSLKMWLLCVSRPFTVTPHRV